MESKQFRIGNLTNFGKVIEINNFSFYVRDNGGTEVKSSWADIQALPLTEEWLLKFGFLCNPYKDRYEIYWFNIDCDKRQGYLDLSFNGVPIRFVHQLQNLYFALTNEELIIK